MSPISLKIRASSALLIVASPLRDTLRGRGIPPILGATRGRPRLEAGGGPAIFRRFSAWEPVEALFRRFFGSCIAWESLFVM